jgi:hypothetical protein
MAAGITGWTTNPNQFVDLQTRTAADAQPLILRVRQRDSNGEYIEDDYVWDIRAICPVSALRVASGRLGAVIGEPASKWRATVYPNPVGQEFSVKLEGAQQEWVHFQLMDLRGRVLVDKQVAVEQAQHQERLVLGEASAGLYLLRVSTARQYESIKVLKGQ